LSQALVIGSVALDSVETPHGKVEDALGGSASFGSVAASYFGPTSLLACVGDDFPQHYVEGFRERGIDVKALQKIAGGKTFRWSGYYERTMNQAHTNTTQLNVFEHFRPELTPEQKRMKFVFLANIHPALQLYVLDQLESPELVALDTMNFWIEGSKDTLTQVIKKVSLLLMNEDEARQYCETTNLIEAGRALLKLGPKSVVIKKGEHGSVVFQEGHYFAIPAYPTSALKDPTGAGDTFAGSLVGYVARLGSASAENIRRGVLMGSMMASFVVEDFSLNRILCLQPEEIEHRSKDLIRIMTAPVMDPATFIPYSAK
jgi:sugar/nucleoside kinase (ribokinase family)